MKTGSSKPLTAEQEAELKALSAMGDDEIDTSDMPEVKDWSKARRGALYRPLKKSLTVRFDADVIEWFKSHGGGGEKGYQTRMNAALREYIQRHEHEAG